MTTPAASATDPYYPAAQCAAYWLGRHDFARQSSFLRADPKDLERAAALRSVAIRLNSGESKAIDDFIAAERGAMALMVEAAIYSDKTSDELQARLLEVCADFAATQPETRGLQ